MPIHRHLPGRSPAAMRRCPGRAACAGRIRSRSSHASPSPAGRAAHGRHPRCIAHHRPCVRPPTADGDSVPPKVVVEGTANIAPARAVDDASKPALRRPATPPRCWRPARPLDQCRRRRSGLPSDPRPADDRLRIRLDGADITASCPNHTNPALSYVAPSDVARIVVYLASPRSRRAATRSAAASSSSAASPASRLRGGHRAVRRTGDVLPQQWRRPRREYPLTIASEHLSCATPAPPRVRATIARGRVQWLRLHRPRGPHAGQGRGWLDRLRLPQPVPAAGLYNGDHLLEARLGWQQIPRQDHPNQRMDLTDNRQRSTNLRYLGQFGWGRLEARAYRETLDHAMDFGPDKRFWYGAASGGNNRPADRRPCARRSGRPARPACRC